jgi:hypothetical protein
MAHIKVTVPCLIGTAWREKGEIVEVPPRVAEAHVRARTAIAVPPPEQSDRTAGQPPPIEQAMMPPRGDKAVSPRQK